MLVRRGGAKPNGPRFFGLFEGRGICRPAKRDEDEEDGVDLMLGSNPSLSELIAAIAFLMRLSFSTASSREPLTWDVTIFEKRELPSILSNCC